MSAISATTTRMPEPGDVLLGRFRVESVIGRGGMGIVYRAVQLSNSGPVAIKVLSPEASMNPEAVPRFINEARASMQMKSAHVVRVFDVGTLDIGLPFIVMELLEGNDLGAILEMRKHLPEKEAVDYVIQACEGLSDAHGRGIVHRDLKPSNLFLSGSTRSTQIVKVLDFGVSKIASGISANQALTATGSFLGSAHYMSPEQLKNAKDVDARADIWSMGVILYELIGGRLPFDGGAFGEIFMKINAAEYEPLRVQKPQVPQGLDYVISRCLRKDREARYPTLGDFVHAIAPFGTPEGTARAQRMARALGVAPPSSNPIVDKKQPQSDPHLQQQPAAQQQDPPKRQQTLRQVKHGGQQQHQEQPSTIQGMPPAPPLPPPQPPPRHESSSGFAAPLSQPGQPIGNPLNAAQQLTYAASSTSQPQTLTPPRDLSSARLANLPASTPALPLHYGSAASANQASQSHPSWGGGAAPPRTNASEITAPGTKSSSPFASLARLPPMILAIGIGLVVFAVVGLILIIVALRARGGTAPPNVTTPTSASVTAMVPPPPAPPSTAAAPAPTPETEPEPVASASAAGTAPSPPPPPPAMAAPHVTGASNPSILNKRK